MPNMNGHQLAQRLASRDLPPRILYMSGYTDDAVARHGVLDSGMILLQKLFSPSDLLTQVRNLLDTRIS